MRSPTVGSSCCPLVRDRVAAREERLMQALIDYYDLARIDHFLIRGFDPLQDAITYGRELLPLVRDRVAAREERLMQAAG